MSNPDWLKIYAEQGLSALNKALDDYDGDQVAVLKYLEHEGFEIKWRYSSDGAEGADFGAVIAGR